MYEDFSKDIGVIKKYCEHAGSTDRKALRELGLEALEIFLTEVRRGGAPVEAKLTMERELLAERVDKVAACLGEKEVERVIRDFQSAVSIVSWNVNGLRARIVDNLLSTDKALKGVKARVLQRGSPLYRLMNDPEIRANIICLQETKVTPDMEASFAADGWSVFWSSSECTNYSGVCTWVRSDMSTGAEVLLPAPKSKYGAVFSDDVMDKLFRANEAAKGRFDQYKEWYEAKKEAEKARATKKKSLLGAGECHPLINGGRILALRLPVAKLVVVNTYVPNTNRAGSTTLASRTAYEAQKAKAESEGRPVPPSSRPFEWSDLNASGTDEAHVIDYREDWDRALTIYLTEEARKAAAKKAGWGLVWCGDLNVARTTADIHQGAKSKRTLEEVDAELEAQGLSAEKQKGLAKKKKSLLKRLTEAELMDSEGGHSGFRLTERAEFEKILSQSGLVDVHRFLCPEHLVDFTRADAKGMSTEQASALETSQEALMHMKERDKDLGFTYWNQQRPTARPENEGMRIDYFCITPSLVDRVYMEIFPDIGYAPRNQPSDHAPILLKIMSTQTEKTQESQQE